MITIRIEGIDKKLAEMGKQIQFATAVALTRTAKLIADEQMRNMPSELDRPKPATVRAMKYTRATKDNLTATVRFKNRSDGGIPAEEFIGHNVTGGRRGLKRSEIMLRAAGLLPDGLVTIPGAAAKLDAHGNMSRGQIVSILSFFKTFGVARYSADLGLRGRDARRTAAGLLNTGRMNRAAKSRGKTDYFVVSPGSKLPAGIWERTKAKAKPVLMFVSPGTHGKFVKFYETGNQVVARDFGRLLNVALAEALRTAR